MNLANILMCWNIPRVSEEHLYELFCVAGPIEDISYTKNGKSCFIVYEYADAVTTAKDIFRDVRLNGRPLRMLDYDEITRIYSAQEQQIAERMNSDYDDSFRSRSFEGPNHFYDRRMYPLVSNRNAFNNCGSERYAGSSRIEPANDYKNHSYPFDKANMISNSHQRSYSMRNTSMTSTSGQNRSDLLPSTSSQSSKKREFDPGCTVQDLLIKASSILDQLNPYSMPVSKNSGDQPNRMYPKLPKPDYREHDAEQFSRDRRTDTSGNKNYNFRHSNRTHLDDRPGRRSDEDFDSMCGFENLINRGDVRHQNLPNEPGNSRYDQYRDHSSRMRHPDRELYQARSSKLHNLPPVGTDYKSRKSFYEKRSQKYREEGHRSRKY